ncbi:hypothetical protein GCM10009861_25150 [Neomicrococcus aestuarii]
MMMAAVSGVFTGASLVFLVIVGALGFTYATPKAVHLPGLIQAWFTTENAMPAVNFQPNFAGMLVKSVWVLSEGRRCHPCRGQSFGLWKTAKFLSRCARYTRGGKTAALADNPRRQTNATPELLFGSVPTCSFA